MRRRVCRRASRKQERRCGGSLAKVFSVPVIHGARRLKACANGEGKVEGIKVMTGKPAPEADHVSNGNGTAAVDHTSNHETVVEDESNGKPADGDALTGSGSGLS